MTLDEKENEKADDVLPTASLCRHYTARATGKLRNFPSLVKARMALSRLVALRSTFPLRDNVVFIARFCDGGIFMLYSLNVIHVWKLLSVRFPFKKCDFYPSMPTRLA